MTFVRVGATAVACLLLGCSQPPSLAPDVLEIFGPRLNVVATTPERCTGSECVRGAVLTGPDQQEELNQAVQRQLRDRGLTVSDTSGGQVIASGRNLCVLAETRDVVGRDSALRPGGLPLSEVLARDYGADVSNRPAVFVTIRGGNCG